MLVPPGGPPHVIDFNGRFYASLESAMAAGVNFPVIWAELALGHHGHRQRIEANRVSDCMDGTGEAWERKTETAAERFNYEYSQGDLEG